MLDAGRKSLARIARLEKTEVDRIMTLTSRWTPLIALAIATAMPATPQGRHVSIRLNLNETAGPLEMDRFALGQGGLSEEPMWADRLAEIRDLHPRLIRLFIQEYFDLLPERGRYNFQKLDESVDLIL